MVPSSLSRRLCFLVYGGETEGIQHELPQLQFDCIKIELSLLLFQLREISFLLLESSINFLCFHLELLPIGCVPQTFTLSSSGLSSQRRPSLEHFSVSLGFHDNLLLFHLCL